MPARRALNFAAFWFIRLTTTDLDNLKFLVAFLAFISSHILPPTESQAI
jgi:hypothetical protein